MKCESCYFGENMNEKTLVYFFILLLNHTFEGYFASIHMMGHVCVWPSKPPVPTWPHETVSLTHTRAYIYIYQRIRKAVRIYFADEASKITFPWWKNTLSANTCCYSHYRFSAKMPWIKRGEYTYIYRYARYSSERASVAWRRNIKAKASVCKIIVMSVGSVVSHFDPKSVCFPHLFLYLDIKRTAMWDSYFQPIDKNNVGSFFRNIHIRIRIYARMAVFLENSVIICCHLLIITLKRRL